MTFPYSDYDYAYKLDVNGNKTTIYGQKVSRIKRWDRNQKVFESDVPRETRVLTDRYLNSDDVSINHRIAIIDIEVSSDGGFAEVDKANKEITAIALFDQAQDRYVMFVLNKDDKISDSKVNNEYVFACATEDILLEKFMKYWNNMNPTIVSGWNINQYDIPYLYNRLKRLYGQDSANMLSPIGIIKYSNMRKQYQIAGISCLDYFDLYQKFTYARRPSYRLDAIGKYEVNMGKIEYSGTLDSLFKEDINKFIEYNLQDVKIVAALDKKMKLIDLVRNISHVGHTQYEDYRYSSKYIEGTILVYLHRKNVICTNKPEGGREEFEKKLDEDEDAFEGAFVKEPTPGLYEWVYNLDLQSLYPSIIMSLNISPETKVGKIYDWDIEKYVSGKMPVFIGTYAGEAFEYTPTEFSQFMKSMNLTIASNGVLYTKDQKGVIPEILDKWFGERKEYKRLQKEALKAGKETEADYFDRRQHVQKILLNSIYGVLGLPIFRFYDLDNAEAVTLTGQDVIKSSAKYLNSIYQKANNDDKDYCIYIDTDSLYFSSRPLENKISPPTNEHQIKEYAIRIAQDAALKLNAFYDTMASRLFFCDTHRFVIKGEALSRSAIWLAKKRYAMMKIYDLDNDTDIPGGKLAVKGLDVVRSSFPAAYQVFMKKTLNDILQLKPKSEIDASLLAFRKSLNDMSFVDIARNTSIKNIENIDLKREKSLVSFPHSAPAHTKAVLTYNRWLRNNKVDHIHQVIRDGDKIKWAYLKENPLNISTMALKGYDDPPELVEFVNTYLDYAASYERELATKLQDFYTALNWGMLVTEQNQAVNQFFEF